MLWSLFKITFFLAFIGALSVALSFLAAVNEGVIFRIANTEYLIGLAQLLIGILLVAFVLWLAIIVLRFVIAILRLLAGDREAFSRYFVHYRRKRGLNLLSDALMALATGDGRRALQKAKRAERVLKHPEITTIITAQAADILGDKEQVDAALKALLKEDKTRFLGVRGLLRRKLADGDEKTALAFAGKAVEMNPKNNEISELLLRLQLKSGDWDGAWMTLALIHKHQRLPKALLRRRDGIILTAKAREKVQTSGVKTASADALKAAKLVPDFSLAVTLGAEAHLSAGHPRRATKLLEKAWIAAPHPSLATLYNKIAVEASAQERFDSFKPLLDAVQKTMRGDETVVLVEAELALAAGDVVHARAALEPLCNNADSVASAPILSMMASVELRLGAGEHVVREWLEKAICAPSGPKWVCNACENTQEDWAPICSICDAIDSFDWRRAKKAKRGDVLQSPMSSPTQVLEPPP